MPLFTVMIHRCIVPFWSFCLLSLISSRGSARDCQLLYSSLSVWSCLCQIVVSHLFSVQTCDLLCPWSLLSGGFTACCFWIFGLVSTRCLSLEFNQQALVTQESELITQLQHLRTIPATLPVAQAPWLFPPQSSLTTQHEPYSGEPRLCQEFLTRCLLFFSLQLLTFPSE